MELLSKSHSVAKQLLISLGSNQFVDDERMVSNGVRRFESTGQGVNVQMFVHHSFHFWIMDWGSFAMQ